MNEDTIVLVEDDGEYEVTADDVEEHEDGFYLLAADDEEYEYFYEYCGEEDESEDADEEE